MYIYMCRGRGRRRCFVSPTHPTLHTAAAAVPIEVRRRQIDVFLCEELFSIASRAWFV